MVETPDGPGRRPAVNPEDVLDAIKEHPAPFLATGEIAGEVNASKPTARDRLKTLEKSGEIVSRTVGGNTPIWYLPQHENRRLSQFADSESAENETEAKSPPSETETAEAEPAAATDGGLSLIAQWIADHTGVSVRSAKEHRALERVARAAVRGAVLAVLVILSAFAVVIAPIDQSNQLLQFALGLSMCVSFLLIVFAAIDLILLYLGWYAPQDTVAAAPSGQEAG